MNNNISLVAFGTFGNPNGFKQSFFKGNSQLAISIKAFDLKTDGIQLFPKTKLYALRKEKAGEVKIISYSLYSFAKEQNSERGGTFIGSSILFENEIAEENISIRCLTEFHQELVENNLENEVLRVNHSDQFVVKEPIDFDKTHYHLKSFEILQNYSPTGDYLVYYCETNAEKLQHYLAKALELLNVYDCIYFTDSSQIAEYVHQKSLFKLVQNDEFDREIDLYRQFLKDKMLVYQQHLKEEQAKMQQLCSEKISQINQQIQAGEKIQKENQKNLLELQKQTENTQKKFEQFSNFIEHIFQKLNPNSTTEVEQLYNENLKIFNESLKSGQTFVPFNKIEKIRPKLNQDFIENTLEQPETQNKKKEPYKLNLYKLSTFILLFIGMFFLVWFMYQQTQKTKNVEQATIQPIEKQIAEMDTVKVSKLNPIPNGNLLDKEKFELSDLLKKESTSVEITEKIFKEFPKNTKQVYEFQKNDYSEELVLKNKNCFQEKNGKLILVKDSLRNIPIYQAK